jgi:hypothetical protein
MSSRSLAAARARRAGENAPPVSGSRPGTSIGSHAAFAPQQGYTPPTNVRTTRTIAPPTKQTNAYNQVKQSQGSLPFTKISVSDAIGLITLRLGRVEEWIVETINDDSTNNNNNDNNNSIINDNTKSIDNSILTSIINRLDSIETKEGELNNIENISNLSQDISKFKEQLTRLGDETSNQNILISKHTEQLFKFERELIETKDILKTFMMKYDVFCNETNEKFVDYEYVISELEKNIQIPVEVISNTVETEETTQNDIINSNVDTNNSIMSVDLKTIINQELAANN